MFFQHHPTIKLSEVNDHPLNAIPVNDLDENEMLEESILALDTMELSEAAKTAVEMVGSRVYRVTGFELERKEVVIFVSGCQGSGKPGQRDTAELMCDIAVRTPENMPDLIIWTGDNIYDYGATSPLDTGFYERFEKYYRQHYFVDEATLKEKKNVISKVPSVFCLGNHDGNFQTPVKAHLLRPFLQGRALEINQVARNYIPEESSLGQNKKKVSDLVKMFLNTVIDLNDLQAWIEPYYYFSLITGDTQLFFLDSNTYPKEFLAAQKNTGTPNSRNQATWFKAEYDKARALGRKVIIFQHHPKKSKGKRALPRFYDATHYLEQKEIDELNSILGTNTQSYNELINYIFKAQNITEDLLFCAHDHSMSYFVNQAQGISQIITGGGGGDKHARKEYSEQDSLGCYLKNNGFVKFSYPLKQPSSQLTSVIEFFTTKISYLGFGHHLKFKNNSIVPVRNDTHDLIIENFRLILLKACANFLSETTTRKEKIEEIKTKNSQEKVQLQKEEKKTEGFMYYVGNLFSSISSNLFSNISSLGHYLFSDGSPEETDFIHDMMAILNQPTLPEINQLLTTLQTIYAQLPDKNAFLKTIEIELAHEKNSLKEQCIFSEIGKLIFDLQDMNAPLLRKMQS